MCDGGVFSVPITLAIMSAATAVYTTNEQGKAQAEAATAQAQYGADVAAQEAATQDQLAKNEISKGIADRERHLRDAGRKQGEAASMLAANGFALDSGSAASMLAESAEESAYDANIISHNAANAAWSHSVGATNAQNQQSAYIAQGQNAKYDSKTGMLAGGASLLGSLGSNMSMFKSTPSPESPDIGTSYLYKGKQWDNKNTSSFNQGW